jgi:hypothetical protein
VSAINFPVASGIPLWSTPTARRTLARAYRTKSSGTLIRNPWLLHASRANGFSISRPDQRLLEITALEAVEEKPNELAYRHARLALSLAELFEIDPTDVTASADGGVALCFKLDGMYADIECFNSGEIWGITSDRINPATTWRIEDSPVGLGSALLRIKSTLNA